MSYHLTISDNQQSYTFDVLNVPITDRATEGANDNVVLNGNVFTDFLYLKRTYVQTFAWMDEEEYAILRGFYERQFSEARYPYMTMSELGVSELPIRLTIDDGGIINNCGTRQNVRITMRETEQL